MPDAADLVRTLYDRLGKWQAVADALSDCGTEHPRSYWHGIAFGRIQPGWREVDALRVANGVEPQGPPPADLVAAHDIGNVIEQEGVTEYDTLALAYIGEADCAEVLVKRQKRGANGDGHKPGVRVTAVTSTRKRRARLGLVVDKSLGDSINQWRNRHSMTWDEWHERAHELMRREYGDDDD